MSDLNMKYRFCVVVFYLLITFNCYPQSISVSSFGLLDNDLTANTAGTLEKDQNGETAALIKVVTTQTGYSFDSGSIGIVKTKQTPGEIWVYIPRGAKKMSIKHPQLGVLRDYYFPIAIESARTYEMVLISGTVETIVKQSRTSQYVVFQLKPENAIVEIDGELLETEKGTATKMLKFGTYNYRVKAPNYLPEAGQVVVDNPEKKIIVNVSLTPNFSQITVNVDNDAEIWVNGVKKGNGTWSGELGSGTYDFEAKKENHRSTLLTRDIIVTKEPQIITLQSPIPIYGEANINSSPAIAKIYLDGKYVGDTPLVVDKLLIGNHSLSVRKAGFIDNNSIITIKENETTDFKVSLIEGENTESKSADMVVKPNPDNFKIGIKDLKDTGLKTHDGGSYYGDMKSGKPNGYGRAVYLNGDIYEGDYVNGKRQGNGIYKFYDGEMYVGEWYNDQQHGKGTYFFGNKNVYEGMWFRDYQQGHGVLYYFNGDIYDGEWKQEKRNGVGKYTFSQGAYYNGEWKNDKKHGQGYFDWGDGASYDGQWENNMRSGKGTFRFANGDVYIGQWKNDMQNGKGKLTTKAGETFDGTFKDGKFVK